MTISAERSLAPARTGVGGWLLFFCLVLTVLGPAGTIYNLASTYGEVVPQFEHFPSLLAISVVDWILSIAVVGFGVVAGIVLWRIRPGAVKLAQRYLWAMLAYHVVSGGLPFLAGLPPEANQELMMGAAKSVFIGFVYFGVWYAYLRGSKRVAETYLT